MRIYCPQWCEPVCVCLCVYGLTVCVWSMVYVYTCVCACALSVYAWTERGMRVVCACMNMCVVCVHVCMCVWYGVHLCVWLCVLCVVWSQAHTTVNTLGSEDNFQESPLSFCLEFQGWTQVLRPVSNTLYWLSQPQPSGKHFSQVYFRLWAYLSPAFSPASLLLLLLP